MSCDDLVSAEFRPDIEYAKVDGESLKLDASVPDGEGPFPVAILIHGGGWGGGDKAREHVPPTSRSPTPSSPGSRSTTGSPAAPLAGLHRRRADRHPLGEDHAAEFKGDPKRIALIGYSAGGHWRRTPLRRPSDDTRVAGDRPACRPDRSSVADCERRGGVSPSLQALFERDIKIDDDVRADLARRLRRSIHVSADAPPCLLIHGTVDESVLYSQSVEVSSADEGLGVPCDLITIPGGSHKIELWESIDTDYGQKMIDGSRQTLMAND